MSIPTSFPAGVLVSPGDLQIKEVPQWTFDRFTDPDHLLIEVGACGVCGSDFRYYAGENPWAQHTLGRFVPNPPNIVLGHEYAGTVVAAADSANQRWVGKRVAPICSKVCKKCPDCLAGREHLCPNTVHMGHGQGWGDQPFFPGAYGRYALAWASECFEIADSVSIEEAAMMDILAVCVHAARVGQVAPGRAVLCLGAGPAGNGIAQAALALGASGAVLYDRSDIAIDVAAKQEIATIVTPGNAIPELHYGTVFDTIGSAESFEMALSHLGKQGTLVCLAVHDEPQSLNLMRLGSERRLATSCNFERRDFETALGFLTDGKLKVREWLTPIALSSLPTWFAEVNQGRKGAFKLLVQSFVSS